MARAWLTPDTLPSGVNCWLLEIPDSIEIEAIVRGCLFLLTVPENWEQYGSITPDEIATAMMDMLDTLHVVTCP